MLAETHVRSLDELELVCHGSTAAPIAHAYICMSYRSMNARVAYIKAITVRLVDVSLQQRLGETMLAAERPVYTTA